ncbi:MAG: NAD-dependent epimerase/dehydratase family protein [Candidatus Methylomirabilis oxygeniifera]|uniref:Putative dihydroflavonol-4-reductase (DFR) (Dihydrokaempferol 4-reductase) n=1 Tax=Methylomirabilis oxygeniifera TaxID=671143 RepID=D5MHJ7_METO1|nr:MAG: NAD-dependent epimerase/dehydratase family protein [Candidatus Methylomirabilis oxyfera]CBE67130.1 putative dihydroflavonol-4-reductase (DFR) (Dihydrokaempferol 4-reductase) [Candidatus Methylomirabilis oxyfera]
MLTLVTGGTGFVGAAVVRLLLSEGYSVRALARHGSDLRNLDGLDVDLAFGDLLDKESLRQACKGCRRLYHVGAHYSLWEPSPEVFYRINVDGTRNLLEVAIEEGVERVVYTSTVGALGYREDGGPANEETPVSLDQMIGHYKRSKFLAEEEARKAALRGLPIVIVNPSTPVGPRDIKPTPTGRIIVDFLNRRMPAYIDTGLNFIDVDDVAKGHLLAAERGRVGERYILGRSNLTLQRLFAVLGQIAKLPPPRVRLPYRLIVPLAYGNHWLSSFTRKPPRIPLEGVKMAKRRMFFDASKAVRELGLPQSPIERALEEAVRWFTDHGYVAKP